MSEFSTVGGAATLWPAILSLVLPEVLRQTHQNDVAAIAQTDDPRDSKMFAQPRAIFSARSTTKIINDIAIDWAVRRSRTA